MTVRKVAYKITNRYIFPLAWCILPVSMQKSKPRFMVTLNHWFAAAFRENTQVRKANEGFTLFAKIKEFSPHKLQTEQSLPTPSGNYVSCNWILSYWNRPFSKFHQASTWLGVGKTVSWSPVISPVSIPLPTTNFAIIPTYGIPTPNALSFIIVLTVKLFCIVVPYLYVVIGVLCGPLYHWILLLLLSLYIHRSAI